MTPPTLPAAPTHVSLSVREGRTLLAYVVEAKRAMASNNLLPAINQLLAVQGAKPANSTRVQPMLVARYFSPQQQRVLQERGIAYADATGKCCLTSDDPLILLSDRGASADPWRGPGHPTTSLKGLPAARLVRALADFAPPYSVADLADLAGASLGAAYRLSDYLVGEGLLRRGERGPITEVDWPELLRRWSQEARYLDTSTTRGFIEPRGLDSLVEKFDKQTSSQRYAVSGSLATQPYASYAEAGLGLIYTEDPMILASDLGLRPVESGANVIIAAPRSPVVFERLDLARHHHRCSQPGGRRPPRRPRSKPCPKANTCRLDEGEPRCLTSAISSVKLARLCSTPVRLSKRTKDSVTLIGAQAVYLRAGSAPSRWPKPPGTPTSWSIHGSSAGSASRSRDDRSRLHPQPGQPTARCLDVARGIAVDLMVPERLAGSSGRRGVRIPPHDNDSARRAARLEAAIVDRSPMSVESLDDDGRSAVIDVAGPAALLVAKLHKLSERVDTPDRLNDGRARRLPTAGRNRDRRSRPTMRGLQADEISQGITAQALAPRQLFASPQSLGSTIARRAEEGVGQPGTVSASASFLAKDLLSLLA